MKVIVGLGNPGLEHQKNRHNTGFLILDKYAKDLGFAWETSSKFDSEISVQKDFILVKPQTFMNNSGTAVSKVLSYYKVDPKDLVVIHDDVDLPFLGFKKQLGAGPAGHHGVEDIIEKLGTQDFWRIRIGLGRPMGNILIEDWVLQDFGEDEINKITQLDVGIATL
jgi:PTH1 family peptidyl-tRNA hydrolase